MHTATIEEVKQLSDGELAVRVRCCSDPLTDSWATITNADALDEAGLNAVVEGHKAAVSAKHGRIKAALDHMRRLTVS